jgi:hypothetical protein
MLGGDAAAFKQTDIDEPIGKNCFPFLVHLIDPMIPSFPASTGVFSCR